MPRDLNAAELNVSLLRALGVDPVGVTAAVLTLRAQHPPRIVVTRVLRAGAGVVQQVQALDLHAVAAGEEGMPAVSVAGEAPSMSTGGAV